MIFLDYHKRILDDRENIINYYVKQFGPDKRKMFEERFDRIKFCFWVSQPDEMDNIVYLKFHRQYLQQTINFIIDTIKNSESEIDIRVGEYSIICNDDKIVEILKNFFGPTRSIADYYGPIHFGGIWTFLEDLSETSLNQDLEWHNSIMESLNKKKSSLEEYILSGKCDFLRKMGCFPEDMDDETIAGSEEFDKYAKKYSELAKKALEYKRRAEKPVIEFIEYCKSQKAKEEELGNDRMSIAKSRIIGGNFIPENEEDIECLFVEGIQQVYTKQTDGKITDVIIFYNPFFEIFPENAEINIRHEIRHAMTASACIRDGEEIEKIGNKIVIGEKIEAEIFNEFITQRDAIEETRQAVAEGRCLINEEVPPFEEYVKVGEYDYYPDVGNLIISQEPLLSDVTESQIAETNDDLYKVISLKQIQILEELMKKTPALYSEDIKKLKDLMKEIGIQDVDAKLKEQFGYDDEEQEI